MKICKTNHHRYFSLIIFLMASLIVLSLYSKILFASTTSEGSFVINNLAPVLQPISDIIASGGDLITIIPNATDPNGDAVTYTFSFPFNSSGQWQTKLTDSGTFYINITASDGSKSSSEIVTLNISGSHYCGDGDCSSGESISTCPKDCKSRVEPLRNINTPLIRRNVSKEEQSNQEGQQNVESPIENLSVTILDQNVQLQDNTISMIDIKLDLSRLLGIEEETANVTIDYYVVPESGTIESIIGKAISIFENVDLGKNVYHMQEIVQLKKGEKMVFKQLSVPGLKPGNYGLVVVVNYNGKEAQDVSEFTVKGLISEIPSGTISNMNTEYLIIGLVLICLGILLFLFYIQKSNKKNRKKNKNTMIKIKKMLRKIISS